jgi:hypothetical protein
MKGPDHDCTLKKPPERFNRRRAIKEMVSGLEEKGQDT